MIIGMPLGSRRRKTLGLQGKGSGAGGGGADDAGWNGGRGSSGQEVLVDVDVFVGDTLTIHVPSPGRAGKWGYENYATNPRGGDPGGGLHGGGRGAEPAGTAGNDKRAGGGGGGGASAGVVRGDEKLLEAGGGAGGGGATGRGGDTAGAHGGEGLDTAGGQTSGVGQNAPNASAEDGPGGGGGGGGHEGGTAGAPGVQASPATAATGGQRGTNYTAPNARTFSGTPAGFSAYGGHGQGGISSAPGQGGEVHAGWDGVKGAVAIHDYATGTVTIYDVPGVHQHVVT